MKLHILAMAAALLLGGCVEQDRARADADTTILTTSLAERDSVLLNRRCQVGDSAGQCILWGPSLVELITRPEVYDGRRVRVIGFVNFEFEGNGLYVSREDWRESITHNGLWIDPPSGFESDSGPPAARPNRQYAIVEGTFNAANSGHMGMWSGAIENVTRLEPWGTPNTPPVSRR